MKPIEPGAQDSRGSRPTIPVSGHEPETQSPSNHMNSWDERVVALHEGRVSAAEREEILNQILTDDDEYELFAATAAVLAELEAAHGIAPPVDDFATDDAADDERTPVAPVTGEIDDRTVISLEARRPAPAAVHETPPADRHAEPAEPVEGVVPIESKRKRRSWVTYGAWAAGIAAVGIGIALFTRPPSRLDDPAQAVAMLESSARGGVADGWKDIIPVPRGDEVAADTAASFRLGSLTFDLELASDARDTALIREIAGKVSRLLANTNGGNGVADLYEEIQSRASSGGDVSGRVKEGRERIGDYVITDWYELGVWSEAARTAALRGDSAFFRTRASRSVLERSKAMKMDEYVATPLNEVRNAIQNGANLTDVRSKLDEFRRVASR